MLCLLFAFPAHADLRVVASIKPLHSLVAAVMQGAGEPALLVQGDASPHTAVLKPSQVRALQQADIVFYIGDDFERFLPQLLNNIAANADRADMERIAMEHVPGIKLYPLRNADVDEKGAAHDLHLWLMPDNAQAMVRAIDAALSARDPVHAALYHANAERLRRRLAELDYKLAIDLAQFAHSHFLVFHDAYQYFERAFGLQDSGAITLSPEELLRPRHIEELRARIEKEHITCVFREPGFPPNIVNSLTQGTPARSAVLDPEAQRLEPGPELYFQLMRGLEQNIAACLSAK